MSKRSEFGSLYDSLNEMGLLDYGSNIPSALVHELLDITVPMRATKAEFDALSLQEMSAIDYCRNILLGQGKYLAGTRAGYTIPMPSDNKVYIDRYVDSASKKLNRAQKLNRNTPEESNPHRAQTDARIHFRKNGRRGAPGDSSEASPA